MLAAGHLKRERVWSEIVSGINQQVIYGITQIKSTFADEIGNPRTGTGTGFFLRARSRASVFITNRHNLDPALKIGPGWSLAAASIRLRRFDDKGEPMEETKFVAIDLGATRQMQSSTADVSILVAPKFVEPKDYGWKTLDRSALATDDFLRTKPALMDFVSFVGFAGSGKEQWWDQRLNTPIARLGTLASPPGVPFSNESISTGDVGLVSGLSFAGSSGSPLFLHQKGLGPGGDVVDSGYTPACIIGIMSGHWREPSVEPAMLLHSGLSYFTRATAINALLALIEP
jgi:hypothetical protein